MIDNDYDYSYDKVLVPLIEETSCNEQADYLRINVSTPKGEYF